MDTSPEYIKQCEKATEIQTKGCMFDSRDFWFCRGGGGRSWGVNWKIEEHVNSLSSYIWLPRQDQLQLLSGLTWRQFDAECQKYDAETKEQAGIQVVMSCQSKKKWLIEEWKLAENGMAMIG